MYPKMRFGNRTDTPEMDAAAYQFPIALSYNPRKSSRNFPDCAWRKVPSLDEVKDIYRELAYA